MAADGKVKIDIVTNAKEATKDIKNFKDAFEKNTNSVRNAKTAYSAYENAIQENIKALREGALAGTQNTKAFKDLAAQTREYQKALQGANAEVNKALGQGKQQVQNTNNLISSLKNLFGAYLGYQGIRSVINYSLQAVEAFRTQERAILSLNTTLSNAGVYTAQYSQKIQNLASEIQSYSNYGDEAIIKAQALGQAYAGQIPITERATKAVVDFAAATGMDLEQAFALFGKSVGTSINALGRYGVELDKGMSKSQKMEAITKQLGARYQGQARQMADATVQLKNTISDLAENIGEILNPMLQRSATYWKNFTQEIIDARKEMKLLATENQKLQTLENSVNKTIALQGELYRLNDKFNKGGITKNAYSKRKAELEQEIKLSYQWQKVYAKRQVQEEKAAKSRKAIRYDDDFGSFSSGTSTGSSQKVQQMKDAYEKLQASVAAAKREIELAAIAHGTSSQEVQNAFVKYRELNGQLSSIQALFETEKIKVEENKGAYQILTDRVTDLTAKLRDLAAEQKIGSEDWINYKADLSAAQTELQNVNKALQDNGIKIEHTAKSISSSLSSGLVNALRNGGSAFDMFSNLAVSALQKVLDKLLEMSLTPFLNNIKNSSSGGFFTGLFSLFGFKNGAAFQNGNVIPFARGGVVNKPTLFPMANGGTGLMGEAGAEAVMPLKRMSNGKLGVEAENAGGQVVNIYNYSNANVETRKKDDNTVDVFIRRVNDALANERTSAGFRSAYSRESNKGIQAV